MQAKYFLTKETLLILALGLSLVIIQNEKQLPPELQNQKS